MRTYKLSINNQDFSVRVLDSNREGATMEVAGQRYRVSITGIDSDESKPRSPGTVRIVKSDPPPQATEQGQVNAPIPGCILKILISEGQRVEVGQAMLVMEAMKMENDIGATCAGTVTNIAIKPGDAVSQGQNMLTITPD